MPKLIIDTLEIEVPKGTKVIEAAERLGIMIPRFCYHPALGAVGACRVCAVKFLEGPVKGVEMSCMQEAQAGMVVSTTDPEAVEFRRYVIEWLMLHHPHDCPVCDEGGHCLLQEETVSGGHAIRRYLGRKRTYRDQYLGPLIQHEMNRCIHCFRCRRFYQDFAGYRDLGAMQIGNRMYFGRLEDGGLESPFSGNLIDVCPTGVYTDKPARFKGRRWDFERGPSICLHCSLGCNTIGSGRYREMVRQEARLNASINGYFICDRGRFGFDYTNRPDRPRRARVGGKEVPWQQGVQAAAEALGRIIQRAGGEAVACLGSARNSLETQGALNRFCRLLGLPDPRFFVDPVMERKVKKAVKRLDARLAVSMREIEGADLILMIGADPINEAPMLALAMRQAYRNGAHVAVIDPRPILLPFEFEHLALTPGNLDLCLAVIARGAVRRESMEGLGPVFLEFYESLPVEYPSDSRLQDRLTEMGRKLQKSKRPVIICGTDVVRETTPELAADITLTMHGVIEGAGLFYLLPGPNGFGAGLLSPTGDCTAVIEAIEKGDIRALVLVEGDPFWLFPNHQRLKKAMDGLELFLVLDFLPSPSVRRADILLPAITPFESTRSSFINQEGRLQVAFPIHRCGGPIAQMSEEKHPPRTFLNDVPGGDPKASSDILAELSMAISGDGIEIGEKDLWAWLAEEYPLFKRVVSCADRAEGMRVIPEEARGNALSTRGRVGQVQEHTRQGQLELLLVDRTFGTEELSCYSRFVRQVDQSPCLYLHREDALSLGLAGADKVSLRLDGEALVVELRVVENMAPGVMVLPRHRELPWQNLKAWPWMISVKDIKRI